MAPWSRNWDQGQSTLLYPVCLKTILIEFCLVFSLLIRGCLVHSLTSFEAEEDIYLLLKVCSNSLGQMKGFQFIPTGMRSESCGVVVFWYSLIRVHTQICERYDY